jgi:hypothetical protein
MTKTSRVTPAERATRRVSLTLSVSRTRISCTSDSFLPTTSFYLSLQSLCVILFLTNTTAVHPSRREQKCDASNWWSSFCRSKKTSRIVRRLSTIFTVPYHSHECKVALGYPFLDRHDRCPPVEKRTKVRRVELVVQLLSIEEDVSYRSTSLYYHYCYHSHECKVATPPLSLPLDVDEV